MTHKMYMYVSPQFYSMLSSARCVVMHSCLAWYVLVHNSAKNGRILLQLGPLESSHWGEDRYAEFMFGLLVLTTKFSVIGAKSYSNWTLLQGHISVRSVKAHWRKALYLQIGKKEPGYYEIHYDMTTETPGNWNISFLWIMSRAALLCFLRFDHRPINALLPPPATTRPQPLFTTVVRFLK